MTLYCNQCVVALLRGEQRSAEEAITTYPGGVPICVSHINANLAAEGSDIELSKGGGRLFTYRSKRKREEVAHAVEPDLSWEDAKTLAEAFVIDGMPVRGCDVLRAAGDAAQSRIGELKSRIEELEYPSLDEWSEEANTP